MNDFDISPPSPQEQARLLTLYAEFHATLLKPGCTFCPPGFWSCSTMCRLQQERNKNMEQTLSEATQLRLVTGDGLKDDLQALYDGSWVVIV